MKPATVILELRSLDVGDLDVQALKLVLKRLLRNYRIRCTAAYLAEPTALAPSPVPCGT